MDELQNQSRNENDWDHIFQVEPLWMREAAKLLAPNQPNRDWLALAKRLGYSDKDIAKLEEDVTPCLALLRDWYGECLFPEYLLQPIINLPVFS